MDILIVPCFFTIYIVLLLLNFPLVSNYPIFAQIRENIPKISLKIYDIRFHAKFKKKE